MRGGFRLGRLFGIDITVDYSWLLIFLLISWNLTVVFSGWHPTWGPIGSVLVAVCAALVFFASIVLHELAHALVAMRFGGRVSSIRLFLFGGVSNLEREPRSPGAELLMAIAGPITSFGVGVALLVLAALITGALRATAPAEEVLASLDPVSTILLWVGPVNIALGLFNLIPGFPLDGGRVLRSILWKSTGDLHKATRWAAWVGQAVGWLFIVFGIAAAFGLHVPFVGPGIASGLWLAFIGWFLRSAAEQSWQQLLVHDVLEGVSVSRLMRRQGWSVPPGVTVTELVEGWFLRGGERQFPVVEDGQLVGMVAMQDVGRVEQAMWPTTPVRAIMTPADHLVTATPRDDLATALTAMGRADVEQLPVLDRGELVGLLDRRDVARWLELRLSSEPRRFSDMHHGGSHAR